MKKDERALASCNLYAILGSIPTLLELDDTARALVSDKTISLGFDVKGGPRATLYFENGRARMTHSLDKCSIRLFFSSPAKFNALIDGNGMPLPLSGFFRLGFLLKEFTKLTDLLSAYLRPTPEALADEAFFACSTRLMLSVIANAVATLGNEDAVARFSASNIVDGVIRLSIGSEISMAVEAKDHHLSVLDTVPETVMSEMCFADLRVARDLFDGNINAVVAVGEGKVRIRGMISQIDNVNRILDRVSLYLA